MKKFAAIIYCIGYGDFLKQTLPLNKQIFDKIIVVTELKDLETQAVCDYNGVQCIATDEVYEPNNPLPNKGLGVNIGLKEVPEGWWAIQLDADICFTEPHRIKRILELYPLEEDKLYGVDRVNVRGWEEWSKFTLQETNPIYSNNCMVKMDYFDMGHRFVIYHWDVGYCPIGYFQMWNPKGSGVTEYPVYENGTVDHSDVQHAKNFHRTKRQLIPDFYAIHLMSGNDPMGANWQGRVTERFVPNPEQPKQLFSEKKKKEIAPRGIST